MNNEFKSTPELPFILIDISTDDERFILQFKNFHENQDEHSVRRGGVTGDFEVIYKCPGTETKFECALTAGDLYTFYLELDNVSEGFDDTAVLEHSENGSKLTEIRVTADKKGHFTVYGLVKNKNNNFKSGFFFEMVMDSIYLHETFSAFEPFFKELEKIQGNRNFI